MARKPRLFSCWAPLFYFALLPSVGFDWSPATNKSAIGGATIGLFSGAVVGAKSGFGRVMISIFNVQLAPLAERDFATLLGVIGGGILGAFFLALLSGILQMLFVRPENAAPVEDSEASNSRADTA